MRSAFLLSSLSVLLCAAPALAQDPVELDIRNKVLDNGRDRPSLTVVANEQADDVRIDLRRDDGKRYRYRTGRLRAGQSRRFVLEVPKGGERHFTGSMEVLAGGEKQTAEFDFAAEIVAPAQLTLDKSKVDLAARTLELISSRPTARVEVVVTSDRGYEIGNTTLNMNDAPAGSPMKITWQQDEGRVLKIAIRVIDPDNFYSGIELYPWRIDIPHEEVHFPTGSFAILKEEEPKLDRSLADIQAAVTKYGQWADVKLFVAGHTDTVGSAASNRTLSLNRARAISAYFRKNGLRIPIFYDGFGEDALAVPTPDETDEIRNRRAEYIVAIEPPMPSGGRRPAWKPLR